MRLPVVYTPFFNSRVRISFIKILSSLKPILKKNSLIINIELNVSFKYRKSRLYFDEKHLQRRILKIHRFEHTFTISNILISDVSLKCSLNKQSLKKKKKAIKSVYLYINTQIIYFILIKINFTLEYENISLYF